LNQTCLSSHRHLLLVKSNEIALLKVNLVFLYKNSVICSLIKSFANFLSELNYRIKIFKQFV
jgi:hypothetical protein